MIGHQRDILATLGIDIWIPKAEPCAPHQNNLWRDQATPENIQEIMLPQHVGTALELPRNISSLAQPQSIAAEVTHTLEDIDETVIQPVLQERIEFEPFSLQLLSMSHCCIVIDATQMTADQQTLWANIQRAVLSEFSELNWPFPWENMQDGRAVEVYIQGFIDAYSVDKNIISLGQIPHISNSKMIQLASLQEMVEQPILKKRLWQFMQKKAISLE
ncbi:hypothetical protein A3K93_04655 [Acinetobacter sp. NCu2D-2]|uniref:hypothetical protein n=1 Tax=Acinetobacter sp. NCu2D-2 TaxID=1608473 RepID=UPI0007CDB44A|nr:hypothetical protein [Acinetobacter sp. NCu2D-2]ANF81549.1 hypothetical protein A3K93_04655 [Acinetobacter sp. NCu2D-2]